MLSKLSLRLGASESTQRQPCFCKLLTISGSRKEGWLWGEKFIGKLLFRQIFLPLLPRRQDLARDVVALTIRKLSLERVEFY